MPLTRLVARSATRPSNLTYSKPNEDYIIVDNTNQIYVICDGVTRDLKDGKYPDPSPSYLAAKTFSEETYRRMLLNLYSYNPFRRLEDAVVCGNHKIRELNSGRIRNREKFLPGTVGVLSHIDEDRFYCIYLGDCSARRFRNNSAVRIIRSQTQKIKQQKNRLMGGYLREDLYNNPKNPMGFGVFTGEEESLAFLQKAVTDIQTGDVVILATDGMDLIFQSDFLSRLKDEDPNTLINISERLETDRKIISDDKSIIILKAI